MGIFKLHQRCAAFCNRRTLWVVCHRGVGNITLKHGNSATVFILLKSCAKLQKATVSFVMSVCPSVRNNSAPPDGFSSNLRDLENMSRKCRFHYNLIRVTLCTAYEGCVH